jgi:hypothetical protein
MATITANGKASAQQFLVDAKNNRQEAPGTGNIAGVTGTVIGASGETILTGGTVVAATTIPQPGKGFPTGKTATHPSGTYPLLVDKTVQQATDVTPTPPLTVSGGLAVSADPNAGSKNALQNFIPCVPAAQGSGNAPAQSSYQTPAQGLTYAPEHE